MLSCPTASSDRFRCPTKWELWRQLLALLPRGRAWQNHEDIDVVDQATQGATAEVGELEVGDNWLGAVPTNYDGLTVMQQFWAAYAEVLEWLHERACALLNEFFCATVNELTREWWIDYGFPDDCEPWINLCEKVRAQGGASCSYLAGLAAARGWVLTCSECDPSRGGPAAGCAAAGCAKTCGCPGSTIWVTIDLGDSPSYTAPQLPPARAGHASAGVAIAINCPPGAAPLQCLIERFKPAHVRAVYTYVGA